MLLAFGGKLDASAETVEESTEVYEAQVIEENDPELFQQGVEEHARYLGMDPVADRDYLWIAKESLIAALPSGWSQESTSAGALYYYNHESGESRWEHPEDDAFRQLFEETKAKDQKWAAPSSPAPYQEYPDATVNDHHALHQSQSYYDSSTYYGESTNVDHSASWVEGSTSNYWETNAGVDEIRTTPRSTSQEDVVHEFSEADLDAHPFTSTEKKDRRPDFPDEEHRPEEPVPTSRDVAQTSELKAMIKRLRQEREALEKEKHVLEDEFEKTRQERDILRNTASSGSRDKNDTQQQLQDENVQLKLALSQLQVGANRCV